MAHVQESQQPIIKRTPAHDHPPLWGYGYIIQRFIVAHINVRDCVWIYREKEGRKERERETEKEKDKETD